MVCFLAFALRTVFYKKLKEEDHGMRYTDILEDVKALKTCELDVKGRKVRLRTELERGAAMAFRSLGMRPPNRILSLDEDSNVVVRD
jgi:hypothetical protein